MTQHYRTLGLRPGATPDQVKSQYRSFAMESHPDHGGSEERMKAVNLAYDAIITAGTTANSVAIRAEAADPLADILRTWSEEDLSHLWAKARRAEQRRR